MNNYQFRGKPTPEALENPNIQEHIKDGWVYGNLIWNNGDPWIVGDVVDWSDEYITHEWWIPVVAETVGQYVRKALKNGNMMFEKDIVKIEDICFGDVVTIIGILEWYEGVLGINEGDGHSPLIEEGGTVTITVLGNIHDNPELLKNTHAS